MPTLALNPTLNPTPITMKHLILIICLLCCSTAANAFWPFTSAPDPIPEYKEKIVTLESHLTAQAILLNRWQIASGSLGIGCVLLLIIGTALGATTRKHHDATSRRLGPTPTSPTKLNGRKPHIMGQTDEEHVHSTLAA